MLVKDQYNRQFKTLRLSLTDVCNLGCVYCMPLNTDEGMAVKRIKRDMALNLPTPHLIQLIARLHTILDFQVIRLTGGEPLLSPQLLPVLAGLDKMGIRAVKITTNGFLLEEKARALKQAGLGAANVSLDAVDQLSFERISQRKNLDKIIRGIDLALELGIPLKLNAVIMRGLNEDQIIPLLEFARRRNIEIRFLELMKMGHLHSDSNNSMFTEAEILKVIGSRFDLTARPREAGATANRWQLPDGYSFGIIANESSPFCSDCDRLRLDSSGNMYGCLSTNIPVKLNIEDSDASLYEKLGLALSHKQALRFTGSDLSMIEIGG